VRTNSLYWALPLDPTEGRAKPGLPDWVPFGNFLDSPYMYSTGGRAPRPAAVWEAI